MSCASDQWQREIKARMHYRSPICVTISLLKYFSHQNVLITMGASQAIINEELGLGENTLEILLYLYLILLQNYTRLRTFKDE
jgi:hypothetical protein